jgi:hypothetical protein
LFLLSETRFDKVINVFRINCLYVSESFISVSIAEI